MRKHSIAVVALVLLVAVGQALGQTSNYWTNAAGGTWTWSDGGNWDTGIAPTNDGAAFTLFTNNASSAYTVQFSGSITSGPFRVTSDKVTFDANGNFWRATPIGYYNVGANTHWIAYGAGETSTVVFSSSAPGTNWVNMGMNVYSAIGIGAGATVRVDDSLGYGVGVGLPYNVWNFGNFTVRGSNTIVTYDTGQGYNAGQVTIDNGALYYIYRGGFQQNGANASLVITNGGRLWTTRNSYINNGAIVRVADGGVWHALSQGTYAGDPGSILVGYNSGTGTLILTNATIYNTALPVGTERLEIGIGNGRGQVYIQQGGLFVSSNGVISIGPLAAGPVTNMLALQNGAIELGSVAAGRDGVITNRGLMRLAGAITGKGSNPALILNQGLFEVGGSIGTLTLTNANLVLAAGSSTIWEFGDTGLDQINIVGGSATILGTNLFALASGAPQPSPGSKYGLGIYTFLIASNITWNPQWDNLTNFLVGLTYNDDYRWGIFDVGGGLQALQLQFIPEPSTVVLLLGGAVFVGRRLTRKRRRKRTPDVYKAINQSVSLNRGDTR